MRATSCRGCGDLRLGELLACPSCGSGDVVAAAADVTGTVVGSSRVHSGSTRPTPFDVVLVETFDGLRVVGFAEGAIAAGARVRVASEDDGVPSFVAS